MVWRRSRPAPLLDGRRRVMRPSAKGGWRVPAGWPWQRMPQGAARARRAAPRAARPGGRARADTRRAARPAAARRGLGSRAPAPPPRGVAGGARTWPGRAWRLRWQPTSTKKSDSTAQMRFHTSLQRRARTVIGTRKPQLCSHAS